MILTELGLGVGDCMENLALYYNTLMEKFRI